MNILIPMAGPDPYRERGFAYCKSLIDIEGQPLIQHVYQNLARIERNRLVVVLRKEEDERFYLREVVGHLDAACIVLRAESVTAGAACTALLAVEYIDSEEELVITNGEQFFLHDLR